MESFYFYVFCGVLYIVPVLRTRHVIDWHSCCEHNFAFNLSERASGGAKKKSTLPIVEQSQKGAVAIMVSSDSFGSITIMCCAGPILNNT